MEAELQTDIVVRPVRDVDAEALGRVHATCWHETYDHLISKAALEKPSRPGASPSCGPTGPRRVPTSRCSPRSSTARSSDSPARVPPATRMPRASASSTSSTCCDAFHGTGIGQRLFDAVVEQDEGVYLWVADDNPRAHRFYVRNGFVLDGATHTEPFLGETLTEVRFVR